MSTGLHRSTQIVAIRTGQVPDRVYRPNIFGAKSTGRAGSYVEDRLNNCIIMNANDEQDRQHI